jgi:flagellar motor switch protein FliN
MSNDNLVSPVRFAPLAQQGGELETNLDLLRALKLEIKVELGRTNLPLKDVLKLGSGAVVELDQLAGEPVYLSLSGKVIAEGEVVAIGSTFGVKLTKIYQQQIAGYTGGAG